MNAESSDRYRTDITFIRQFNPEHAPAFLRAVAALNGFAPAPLGQGFTWCDFGCGDGLTACVLAAANPAGMFFGIDLNPAHVAAAQTLATAGGLANAAFFAADFLDLAPETVPMLDFAVVHGVLSWVDATVRDRLLDLIGARLKPGGMVFLGYDALPGFAALTELRRWMRAEAAEGGDPLATAREAVARMERRRAAGAKFFQENPVAARWVEDLATEDPRFVVHEFFTSTHHPFAFDEIDDALARRGFTFAGSATLFLNEVELAVGPELHADLRACATRRELECRRDFLRNETFRRDVFVKGPPASAEADWLAAEEALVLGTMTDLSAIERVADFGDVRLTYTGAPFEAVLRALAARARPTAALATLPELAAWPAGTHRDAARLLLAARAVTPFAAAAVGEPAAPAGRPRLSAFNRAIITLLALEKPNVVLAAPVAGNGVVMANVDALLLLGLAEAGPAGAVGWAEGWLAERGQTTFAKGEPVAATHLLETRLGLVSAMLPKLAELGVVS